ncbi:MAG TPA: hypothetical protein VFD87_18320, partial [Phototrophicaceae bacterium]|nr:hypothetical protein [Phototrophicaceae bacterium]
MSTRFVIGSILTLMLTLVAAHMTRAAESRAAWQVDWEKTVKAAEDEGALVIYMTQAFEPVFRESFQKQYPKVKVVTATGRGPELSQRVMSER